MHFQYSYAHYSEPTYYYFEGGTTVWEWTQRFSRVFTDNKVNLLPNNEGILLKRSDRNIPIFPTGLLQYLTCLPTN